MAEMLKLYGEEISSRLLIGTALYPSPAIMQDAIRASGASIVTVSLRRETAGGKTGDGFWSLIRELGAKILPNNRGLPHAEGRGSRPRSSRANCSTRRG